MTAVIESVFEWNRLRRSQAFAGKTLGFVPTMGNLHAGHLSLIERSLQQNDICILSIFVNAPQFDEKDDLRQYPRTLEADLEAAKRLEIDYVICPTHAALYPDNYTYRVSESSLSRVLCGRSRKGHFDGVLTVVLKLLLLIKPHRCYFGEKDYQQLCVIRRLVRDLHLPIAHEGNDFKVVRAPGARAAPWAGRLRCEREQRRIGNHRVELAKVIENHG